MKKITPNRQTRKFDFVDRDHQITVIIENPIESQIYQSLTILKGLGVQDIWLTGHQAFNPTVVETLKAEFQIPIKTQKDTTNVLKELKKSNYLTLAIQNSTQSLHFHKVNMLSKGNSRLAFVFGGNKEYGIIASTLRQCHHTVFIPQFNAFSNLELPFVIPLVIGQI